MRKPLLLLSLLVASATVLPGCVLSSRQIARTHHAFAAQYPAAHFERDLVLDLGPLSLWMAGTLSRLSGNEEAAKARRYLSYLNRVTVGIYKTKNLPLDAGSPARLPVLQEDGWQTVVRVREPGEHVWILYRPRRQKEKPSLRDLYVLTLSEKELVMVRLRGRLVPLVQRYLAEEDVLNGALDGVPGSRERKPLQTEERVGADSTRTVGNW